MKSATGLWVVFYSMWKEEVINDLYDTGIKSYKLARLHKVNDINKVAVKTPHCLSETREVIYIGWAWSLIECSLQISNIGKESLEEGLDSYKYKDEIDTPEIRLGGLNYNSYIQKVDKTALY